MEAKLARHGISADGAVRTSAQAAATSARGGGAGAGVRWARAGRGRVLGRRRGRGQRRRRPGSGRRRAVRVLAGGRLRPAAVGVDLGAAGRPPAGQQRRRHLPGPRRPAARGRGHPGRRRAGHRRGRHRRRQAPPAHGRLAAATSWGRTGTMVGDRLDTDGLFARALGWRFGLVPDGRHRPPPRAPTRPRIWSPPTSPPSSPPIWPRGEPGASRVRTLASSGRGGVPSRPWQTTPSSGTSMPASPSPP